MISKKNISNFSNAILVLFSVLIFILDSSFINLLEFNSEHKIKLNAIEFNSNNPVITNSMSNTFQSTELSHDRYLSEEIDSSAKVPTYNNPYTTYFKKIFVGNGVSHMNINLADLNLSGLKVGDEIGVFDSIYCVGSKIIDEQNMLENNLSIPSSANDTIESNPNGYIQGHKITLKVYRNGTIYSPFFQPVNNSKNIFEVGGSMFALMDLSRLSGQLSPFNSEEILISPNPFDTDLEIVINLRQEHRLKCEIFDANWKLLRTLFDGEMGEKVSLIWDGKDSNQQLVQSGKYFCRINQTITEVIYNRLDIH